MLKMSKTRSASYNLVYRLHLYRALIGWLLTNDNLMQNSNRSRKCTNLIMPPVTMPLSGSCQVLNKSWISSCRWGWAHTKPVYFVTSGQSCEATTCVAVVIMARIHLKMRFQSTGFNSLTAAIDGLESSPDSGWVTSAPKIIVGMSLTKGILQVKASKSTVFLPPIYRKMNYITFIGKIKEHTIYERTSIIITDLDVDF